MACASCVRPPGVALSEKTLMVLPYRCGMIQGASSSEPSVYGAGASMRTR